MYKNINDFENELKKLSKRGYIESLRSGDTGVGYTLESCLGIEENNVPFADLGREIELKTFRKDSSSLLTLFTCEPQPAGGERDRLLLEKFGYKKRQNSRQKELYCTINSSTFNPQSLKLEAEKDRIKVISNSEAINIYWEGEYLRQRFIQKMPQIIVVKADAIINDNEHEAFHFNEAYYLKGFSFESFKSMIAGDIITVDFRMHLREAGTVRNHGTAFRIRKNRYEKCFQELIRLV